MEVEKSPSSLFNTEKHRFDRCLKLKGGIIHGDGVTPLATLEGRALIGQHVVISQDRWSIVSAWTKKLAYCHLYNLDRRQLKSRPAGPWATGRATHGSIEKRQRREAAEGERRKATQSSAADGEQHKAVERGGWRATHGKKQQVFNKTFI